MGCVEYLISLRSDHFMWISTEVVFLSPLEDWHPFSTLIDIASVHLHPNERSQQIFPWQELFFTFPSFIVFMMDSYIN